MGGNARVGLEDNLYLEKGLLAKSNAEQVAKIIRIARELGIEPATPQEAREILGLKGMDKVNFYNRDTDRGIGRGLASYSTNLEAGMLQRSET